MHAALKGRVQQQMDQMAAQFLDLGKQITARQESGAQVDNEETTRLELEVSTPTPSLSLSQKLELDTCTMYRVSLAWLLELIHPLPLLA